MKESINKTFNHFKVHTQYSICEGAIKIDALKDFCKTNKIKSVGLSDHSNYEENGLEILKWSVCEDIEFVENQMPKMIIDVNILDSKIEETSTFLVMCSVYNYEYLNKNTTDQWRIQ